MTKSEILHNQQFSIKLALQINWLVLSHMVIILFDKSHIVNIQCEVQHIFTQHTLIQSNPHNPRYNNI